MRYLKSTRMLVVGTLIIFLLSANLALAVEDADALHTKRIETLLLSLPGNIRTSGIEVKGDTLVVRGLTAAFKQKEGEKTVRTVLSIDEISCMGVDFNAVDTPGVQRLAESVRITNYAIRVDILAPQGKAGASSVWQKTQMRSASIKSLYGDVAALNKAMLDTDSPSQSPLPSESDETKRHQAMSEIDQTIRILIPLLSFKIASYNAEGLVLDMLDESGTRIRTEISAISAQDLNALHLGPMKMEGIVLEMNGDKMLSFDSIGYESLQFEKLVTPFLSLDLTKPETQANAMAILMGSLNDLSFSMEGLHLTGVHTLMPQWGDNSLRRMTGSLAVSMAEMKFDWNVDELQLDPALYSSFGPEGKAMADRHGKSIKLSGDMHMAVLNQPGSGKATLQVKASEPNLGNAEFSTKLTYSPDILPLVLAPDTDTSKATLNTLEADLLLEDRGLGDFLVVRMLEKNQQSADGKPLEPTKDANLIAGARAMLATGIRDEALKKGGIEAKAAETLAKLCANAGTARFHLSSNTPIAVEHIRGSASLDLDALGVQYSDSYSEPSKQGGSLPDK